MSNDTDTESISTVPDKSAMASPEEGNRAARQLFASEPIPESPRQPGESSDVFTVNSVEVDQHGKTVVDSTRGSQPDPEPKNVTADSTHGSQPDLDTEKTTTDSTLGSQPEPVLKITTDSEHNVQPDSEPKQAIDSTRASQPDAEPEKPTADLAHGSRVEHSPKIAPLGTPAVKSAAKTKTDVSNGSVAPFKTKLVERPKVETTAKKSAQELGATATTKPGLANKQATKPSQTTRPPTGGPKKPESNVTPKDTGKNSTKPSALPNSKLSSGLSAASSSKSSSGAGTASTSKTTGTTIKPSTTITSTTATKRPSTLQIKAPLDTGFVKPKPKSPTVPVSLPSHLTAHTASSVSRGNAPRQSLSRQSGNLQIPNANARPASRASTSTTSAPAKTVKRQPSNISRSRPSIGPPPKKGSQAEPSSKKGQSQVDEGFLARMMRPTQASSSKVAEKAPTTPPRKTGTRPSASVKNPDTKHEGKGQRKETEGSPQTKRAQDSTQAQSTPTSVTAAQEPHDSTGLTADAGSKESHRLAPAGDSLSSHAQETPVPEQGKDTKEPVVQTAGVETAAEVIQLAGETGQRQASIEPTIEGSAAQNTVEVSAVKETSQPIVELPKDQTASPQSHDEVEVMQPNAETEVADKAAMEHAAEGVVGEATKP
jgi:hypothetical protein